MICKRLFAAGAVLVLSLAFSAHAAAAVRLINDQQITGAFLFHTEQNGYILGAANLGNVNIPVFVNPQLVESGWTSAGDAMPVLPAWAKRGQVWRPQAIRLFNSATQRATFLLYFSARNLSMNRAHCIGVAASNTAIGPYTPQQHPLICLTETEVSEGRESIDPAPFLDDDGTLYLAWKLGGKMNKYLTRINLSKLSPDGLSVVGPTTELMTNDRNSWEGINVEAPFLMKRDGTYYLFYSGNLFQSSEYGVGYAVSRSIAGPYVKSVSNPILSSGPIVGYGPGEETIFRDGCGNDWLGFSDYDNPNEVGLPNERHFHAALLAWPQDGWAVHVDTAPNFSICNGTPKIPPAQINCKDVVLRFWGFDRGLYLYRAGWMQAAYTSSGNLMSGPPIAFEWRACPAHLF